MQRECNLVQVNIINNKAPILSSYTETLSINHTVRLCLQTESLLVPPLQISHSLRLNLLLHSLSASLSLTHAGDDTMHRQSRGGVVEAGDGQALVVLLLLFEDEGGVLLLGDVDVVAGVRGSHDVAGARVQHDALVVLPLHPDQTHTIPVR